MANRVIDVLRRLRAWLTPGSAPTREPDDEPGNPEPPARIVNPVTCPYCGATSAEIMDEDVCVIFLYCAACHERIDMKAQDCCVFRSYGQHPCFHPVKT